MIFQWLSYVLLFATPWIAAHQAPLSFTIFQSLLKLMSIDLVMLSYYLILCHPLLLLPSIFPSIRVFSSELTASGGQSIGALASASVFPMNIQDWFPLESTGLISLQFKRLSRVLSNTTVWKHQFFGTQPSLWSNSQIHTWLLKKHSHSFDNMDLCWQSNVCFLKYIIWKWEWQSTSLFLQKILFWEPYEHLHQRGQH